MKKLILLLAAVLTITACQTRDGVLTFPQGLFQPQDYAALAGRYNLVPENQGDKGAIALFQNGLGYEVAFMHASNDSAQYRTGKVLISRIPGQRALVIASPVLRGFAGKGSKDLDNFYSLIKIDGNKIYFWGFVDGNPVAKGNLRSNSINDVRAFLSQYADAYTMANPPMYTYVRSKF